jgi:hypothetical protein
MEKTVFEIYRNTETFDAEGFEYTKGMATYESKLINSYDNEKEAREAFAKYHSSYENDGSEVEVTEYVLKKSEVEVSESGYEYCDGEDDVVEVAPLLIQRYYEVELTYPARYKREVWAGSPEEAIAMAKKLDETADDADFRIDFDAKPEIRIVE